MHRRGTDLTGGSWLTLPGLRCSLRGLLLLKAMLLVGMRRRAERGTQQDGYNAGEQPSSPHCHPS